MSDFSQILNEILQTGLNLLQSLHISEIRQMLEFVGVQYTEVVVVLVLFGLLQLSKFTAALALAFIITYGGFYMATGNWSSNSSSANRRVPQYNPEIKQAGPNQNLVPTVGMPTLTSSLFPKVEGQSILSHQNHSANAMLPPFFDVHSIAFESNRFANRRNMNRFRMIEPSASPISSQRRLIVSRTDKIKEQAMLQQQSATIRNSKARTPTNADLGAPRRYTRHIKEPMSPQITADTKLRKSTTYADYKKLKAQNLKTGGIDYKLNISSQEASNGAGRAARRSIPAYYVSQASRSYLHK